MSKGAIEQEKTCERQKQSDAVMPLIGPLLDAWDELPNDVKDLDELDKLRAKINDIDNAMSD